MYSSSIGERSKFSLISNNDEKHDVNEFHYRGGVGIKHGMQQHNNTDKITGGGSIENREYNEYENKAIPHSLLYEMHNEQRLVGGANETDNIQVIPEDMHNKLFFSVAHEINAKGNRKTSKKTRVK